MTMINQFMSGANVARPEVSDAEADHLYSIAMEDHRDILEMGAEMDRMADVAVSLEHLTMVAGSVESAKPSELAMVEIGCNLAMAGSNVKADDIVPSLESMEGETISCEGIKEVIGKIWAAIKDFAKRIWKKVTGFFHKIFGALPRLRKSLQSLQKRADSLLSKSPEQDTIECGSELNPLSVGGQAPKAGKDIIERLKSQQGIMRALYDGYTRNVSKAVERATGPMQDFDTDRAETSLGSVIASVQMADMLATFDKAGKPAAVKGDDKRFDHEKVKVEVLDMVGNMGLFTQQPISEGGGVLEGARVLRGTGVRVMSYTHKKIEAIEEGDVKIMTVADVREACDESIAIIDAIESFETGKVRKDIDKHLAKLEKAGDKLSAKVAKESDMSGDDLALCRSALDMVPSFTRWAGEPHTTAASTSLAAVRAMMVIASKSLAVYK